MLKCLRDDGAVWKDLEEPLNEVVNIVEEQPGIGELDEGQGGGQHHPAPLVHLKHEGLAKARLLGGRDEYSWFSLSEVIILSVVLSVLTVG